MKKITTPVLCLIALVFSFPVAASAHATPVEYSPDSSATLEQMPTTVSIQFSERLDAEASTISVKSPTGEVISQGSAYADPANPKSLAVAVKDGGTGTYLVSWSVVSSDDGHFTKGAYPFAVGAGIVVESTASNTEVVTITTVPEALAMAVELMGNGIIWALLLLFIFAARPLLQNGRYHGDEKLLRRGYFATMYFAIALVFAGGLAQIAVKAQSLATLREAPFWPTIPLYIQTAAGTATMYRMIAVLVVLIVFFVGRKVIFSSKKITYYEIAIMLAMSAFAYFRAVISHATANPFFPHFSVAVNFVHLIEKDFWAGAVGILVVLALVPRLRHFLLALMPRAFQILAIDFAVISVTACYIVWLHLKTFDNLFTTQWGAVFLQLLIAAVFLVGMRLYHVFARLYRPKLFSTLLPASLAAELAFGILVVYCSSVVIITSPPLPQPHTKAFNATNNGVTISLERDLNQDNMLMLSTTGKTVPQAPVVTITDTSSTDELSVNLVKRFDGGYVFPVSFLAGEGPFNVSITIPQSGGYDALASFEIKKGDFDVPAGYEAKRAFDTFTIVMIGIGLAALIFASVFWRFSGADANERSFTDKSFAPIFSAATAFLIAALIGAKLFSAFGASSLSNPYKAQCESDGNAWHFMLPSMAGKPTSQISREGCMWGMGNYMYQFPDKREYDYYQSLPQAEVTLDQVPKNITAGIPTTLTLSLRNADGTPATLFVDMEKYVHMVIISQDETEFAHIHPDDKRPLTQKEIDSSTYTFVHTFPKGGKYIIAVDYAHGLQLESKQFVVEVQGGPAQNSNVATYQSIGKFEGYDVTLDYGQPFVGKVETIRYTIKKNGNPVENLQPYLSAPMHISVVKNDFSSFLHTHGEIHPPGVPYPPIIIKNGKIVHSMAMMVLPEKMGPNVEAHVIFPSAGLYTIWGQFKVDGKVIVTSFTARIEE